MEISNVESQIVVKKWVSVKEDRKVASVLEKTAFF
jgi:hypothetical protein